MPELLNTKCYLRPATLALMVGVLALSGFVIIAMTVSAGLTAPFDAWVLRELQGSSEAGRPLGPAWLQETARDVTALGSNGVLGFVVLVAASCLVLVRRWTAAWLLLGSFWGALFLETVLKSGFGRPRPDVVPNAVRVFTESFPSGHATVTAATCFASGVLLEQLRPPPAFRTFVMSAAVSLVILIGATRLYLGVHWPTDVLGGWLLGTSWTCLCCAVAAAWGRGLSGLAACPPPSSQVEMTPVRADRP